MDLGDFSDSLFRFIGLVEHLLVITREQHSQLVGIYLIAVKTVEKPVHEAVKGYLDALRPIAWQSLRGSHTMRLKKWQFISLIVFVILDLMVLGIGFAVVVMPTMSSTTLKAVGVIPSQTVAPLTRAITPVMISATRSTVSPTDSDYVRDHLICDKLRYFATVRDIASLLDAIDKDTIRNVETCNTMVANAFTGLNDANECAVKTGIPEDADLLSHRQYLLAYLESARSMWSSIGTYCETGTQDPKLQHFTDNTGVNLGKARDTMDIYLKRHSEDGGTAIPNPATVAVAVYQTMTALPPKATTTSTSENLVKITLTPTTAPTPSPAPTATPRIAQNDLGYVQDISKCVFYYQQGSKNSNDLSTALRSGAMYNTDFCVTLAAIATVNIDDGYSCTNNSRTPGDSDLRSSRQFYLSGLQYAKSAWLLLGFGCTSKTIDPKVPSLMNQASDEMDRGTKALNRYLDSHPGLQ